eukprot:gene14089-29974_t
MKLCKILIVFYYVLRIYGHTGINIAGLFPLFNGTYGRNRDGLHSLAAFTMAVKEINARSDILPNHFLNYTIRSPLGFYQAVQSTVDLHDNAFTGSGIKAFVTGLPLTETSAINMMMSDQYKTLYLTTTVGSPQLSYFFENPYKVRVTAADAYNGMALQDIVFTTFGYTKVSLFYSLDEISTRTAIEFGDQTYGELFLLSSHTFELDRIDFTDQINAAKKAGSQIFVILTYPQTGARLLEQGYNMELFKEGTQIFGSALLTQSKPWKYMSKDADVPAIMKGYI